MNDIRWVLRAGVASLGGAARRRVAVAVLTAVSAAGAAVGLSAVSAWLIVRASERPPVLHLMVAIVAVRALGLSRGVLRYAERLAAHDLALRVLTEMRVAVVDRLALLLPSQLPPHDPSLDPGRVLTGVIDDADVLTDVWIRVALPVAAVAVVGVGAALGVAVVDPAAALVIAASVAVAIVVAPVVSVRGRHSHELQLAPLRAEMADLVVETVDAAAELTVLGQLGRQTDNARRLARDMALVDARNSVGAAVAAAVAAAIGGLSAALVLVVSQADSSESVAVAVFTALALHEVVAGAIGGLQHLPTLAAAAHRVRATIESAPARDEPTGPVVLPRSIVGLKVDGLTARWPGRDDDALSLPRLNAGRGVLTVVTAPSGGGKTTLAAVVSGVLAPTRGSVELIGDSGDAVDISRVRMADVRDAVLWSPQESMVFDSSVAANLRLARPDASDGELVDALARAGLQEWFDALPHGLDSRVDRARQLLSGGQARRLAVARAMLADRPVTVLDEPTEHLDATTADDVAQRISEWSEDRVVLVISHRPAVFRGAHVVSLGRP